MKRLGIETTDLSIVWVDPKALKPHPKNRNKHPKEQIERLKKMIEYQGFRRPITVSNASGYITVGHGRRIAAMELKLKKVPVIYQDYKNAEMEYADVQADNAIALWAELDMAAINMDLPELGPDFDIDMLGLKDFALDPAEFEEPDAKDEASDKNTAMLTCPNCGVLIERTTEVG